MKINIKLSGATYEIRTEANQMVAECTTMTEAKEGKPSKPVTSILGYYGPGQLVHAINRIIAEEITLDSERVNLREFLKFYKAIHESINTQLNEVTQIFKDNK